MGLERQVARKSTGFPTAPESTPVKIKMDFGKKNNRNSNQKEIKEKKKNGDGSLQLDMENQSHIHKRRKYDQNFLASNVIAGRGEAWQTNSLVWRNLSIFLSLSDLQALRLSCVNFNHQVVHEAKLNSRFTVNLTKDLVKPDVLGVTNYLWKNFVLSYEGKYSSEHDWIYPLLKSAQSLTMVAKSLPDHSYPLLERILDESDNLKVLKLSIDILGAPETPIALGLLPAQAKQNLENIMELHLLSANEDILESPYQNNYIESTGLLLPLLKNLQVVNIECMSPDSNDTDVDDVEPETEEGEINKANQNLIAIILENRKGIRKLHLWNFHLWTKSPVQKSLKSILDQNVLFPRLKSLRLLAHSSETDNLIDFLKRQPLLEELDVAVYHEFPNIILDAIRGKSDKLRSLRIRTKGFETVDVGMWHFLSGCKFLEDFQLHFTKSVAFEENGEYNLVKAIFLSLPGSIKKIYVKSHEYTDFLSEHDFMKINPEILTHLTLRIRCCVNDETMQFICRNFKRLQHLDLRGSTQVCTDAGFTDLRNDCSVSTFSLSSLKGLKSLFLDCGKLTNKTIESGIRFRELKYLFLDFTAVNNQLVTRHGVRVLLKGNPSLEVLQTLGSENIPGFPTLEELKELIPRLRSEISELELEDDLDVYESDHIEDYSDVDLEDSDISGGSYYSDSDGLPFDSDNDDGPNPMESDEDGPNPIESDDDDGDGLNPMESDDDDGDGLNPMESDDDDDEPQLDIEYD